MAGPESLGVCDCGGPHMHAQLWWNAQQLRVVVADALLCSRRAPRLVMVVVVVVVVVVAG